ncbi:MAG: translational GTPase TypA, partial [Anaerolineaceae bacterium]|nr:translational GTPase TypA [Anaerolineaceae bacterium]
SIIENIPQPIFEDGPVQMQITTLDYNDYVGRIGIGRVFRGKLVKNSPLSVIKRNGSIQKMTIKQLFLFEGIERKEVEEVIVGDICAIVGNC